MKKLEKYDCKLIFIILFLTFMMQNTAYCEFQCDIDTIEEIKEIPPTLYEQIVSILPPQDRLFIYVTVTAIIVLCMWAKAPEEGFGI